MNIIPQTLQSISTRTHFLSVAASAAARVTNQSSTITPGIRRQKRIPLPNSDNEWDDNYDAKEFVNTHFSVASSAVARTTVQTSTVTPGIHCQKCIHPPDLDNDWDGTSPDDDVEVVVNDNSAYREYLDYFYLTLPRTARTARTVMKMKVTWRFSNVLHVTHRRMVGW